MKNYLAQLGLALLLSMSVFIVHADDELLEGFHYARLGTVVEPIGAASDKVEVVELFWYGCGHCYAFEPHLHDWLQRKPANVEFIRVPAVFNSGAWRLHARAYYVAEVLGLTDKIHSAMFKAIHEEKKPLNNEQQLARLFAGFGVDEKKFKETLNSFGVEMKVNRATLLTERYGIDGVPALVVAGKYRTDGPMAQTYQGMLQVVNHLVAEEGSGGSPASAALGK
ncbi:MAG: thiol:disulfide interchange protein DsbA/DsbL [Thiohalomonadaceae bacterium]